MGIPEQTSGPSCLLFSLTLAYARYFRDWCKKPWNGISCPLEKSLSTVPSVCTETWLFTSCLM